MIIFHEGLPGSGKSYEATVSRIIPALQAKRQVFAYIEGLNHQMFAEVTGLPLDEITGRVVVVPVDIEAYSQMTEDEKTKVTKGVDGWFIRKYEGLLFQIDKRQVKDIYRHVANDALVVIDELQDFFPSSNKKLDDGITTFVTQHRHRGIDIIAMGQSHKDCHSLWKRRIDQLYHFVKRDVVGRPSEYTWKSYKFNEDKLIKLRSGSGKYDEKYFGLYASHTSDTLNTETYTDDRANLLKSAGIRYGLPAAAAGGLFAVYFLYSFFTGGQEVVHVSKQQPQASAPPPVLLKPQAEVKKETAKPQLTYSQGNFIEEVISESRPRLAALIEGKDREGRAVVSAVIQFMDGSNRVKEQFTLDQLRGFGWIFKRMPYGIKLQKGDKDIAVTAWPIEPFGKVSSSNREKLRPISTPQAVPVQAAPESGFY